MRERSIRACPGRGRLSFGILLGAAAATGWPPVAGGALSAAQDDPTPRVQYVLDASSSMRARFGPERRFDAARRALLALDARLAERGVVPDSVAALWVYGARSHRLERDCTDVRRFARGPSLKLEEALADLSPRGVSPLVFALNSLLSPIAAGGREAWVVLTDGSDTCGRDPCAWASQALARPSRPRIYVLGFGLDEEDARALRCLADATSGYLVALEPDDDPAGEVRRLAAVVRNLGMLRVEVPVGDSAGDAVALQGRVFHAGSDAPLRTIRTGRDEELPGGMYRVVVETVPPTILERVLILPGEEQVVRLEDLARVTVRAFTPDNETVAAYAALVPEGSDEEHYVAAARPLYVRPGSYQLTVEVGDSAALRVPLTLEPGERRTVTVGGSGYVRARAPGLPRLSGIEVQLQEYASGRSSTIDPWGDASAVPAGEYRAVVRSLPVYVQEGFTVTPAETTALVLPRVGTLRVDLTDADGRPLSVPIVLLRPERFGREAVESVPGAMIGTFRSGERQAVLAGTYDLLLETEPSRVERGVRVQPGAERVVSLAVPPAGSDGGGR